MQHISLPFFGSFMSKTVFTIYFFFWLTRTIHFSLKATPNTHASILTHSHTHISQLTHSSINPEVICRKSYNLLWIFSLEAKDIPDYICSRSAVRGENQHLSSSSCSVAWPSLVWAIHNLIKCMESLAMKQSFMKRPYSSTPPHWKYPNIQFLQRESEWPFSLSLICHRSRSRSNLLESSPRSCCRWTACLDHRPSRWSVRPHTAPWAGPQDRDPSTRWWWNRLQLHPGDETSVCAWICLQYRALL